MAKKPTVIRIEKGGRFDKRVPVSVNGRIGHITVGTDTPVGDHILEALRNAGVAFTVVSPAGETDGSDSGVGSEPSTDPVVVQTPAPGGEPDPLTGAPKVLEQAGTGDGTPGNTDGASVDEKEKAKDQAVADAKAKAKAPAKARAPKAPKATK